MYFLGKDDAYWVSVIRLKTGSRHDTNMIILVCKVIREEQHNQWKKILHRLSRDATVNFISITSPTLILAKIYYSALSQIHVWDKLRETDLRSDLPTLKFSNWAGRRREGSRWRNTVINRNFPNICSHDAE